MKKTLALAAAALAASLVATPGFAAEKTTGQVPACERTAPKNENAGIDCITTGTIARTVNADRAKGDIYPSAPRFVIDGIAF